MRLFLRDRILEILKTVVDGISYSLTAASDAEEVLHDCVAALNSINGTLRDNLSNGRAAVYLEKTAELCRNIETLSGINPSNEIIGDMDELISSLFDELTNESEVKLEVVFFPYKASMWDSLESVWLAAKDDPRCNAVVVPIPYYDKLPDGSLGQMHYEGRDFPEYVTVTHYNDYVPSAIQPDIAYIHNPYDGSNYVTSVHPNWYSDKLKKCVRTLVYVPYYVNMTPTKAEMSAAAAFGGADIIIAQNESDAKSYLAHNRPKDVAVLGSPKIDRVLRMEAEKPEMPDEWKAALEGRKIFLLITTVNTLLRFDQSSEKLRKVIDCFKGRNDIALIWRPHPLEAATLVSMRPGQLAEYRELEACASESGFCVVDRTADLERAIALSDAYIGASTSSVCYMYKVTGKPVYSINFEVAERLSAEDYDEALRAEYPRGTLDGDYIWGVCMNYNGLARIDTRDGSMEYVAKIPGDFLKVQNLFTQATRIGDKLLLPPLWANAFAEYDIPSGKFNIMPIPAEACVERGKAVFRGALWYEDYLYMIPNQSRAFARYNRTTGELEYFYDWYREFEKYITREDRPFLSGIALVKDTLFLTSVQDSIIVEMDMKTHKISVNELNLPYHRFHSIIYDGRYFWMTRFIDPEWPVRGDSVVRWDKKSGKLTEFGRFPDDFEMYENCHTHLGGLINFNKFILALPHYGNMLVRIDKASGLMTEFDTGLGIDFREKARDFYNRGSFATTYRENTDTLLLAAMYDYSLLRIDMNTGKTEKHKLRFKGNLHVEAATDPKRFTHDYIYKEHILFPPESFIENCLAGAIPKMNEEQARHFRSFVENTDGTCGKKVHEYVIDSLTCHGV